MKKKRLLTENLGEKSIGRNFGISNISNLIMVICLLISIYSKAQKQCDYQIDTSEILNNQNLSAFILNLQTDSFKISYSKKDIPRFINKQLDCLTNGFSIANPGHKYQCCCTSSMLLPERQLIFLGISEDIFVMTYLTGGIGVSTHLLLIKFENNRIIDLWTGHCNRNSSSIKEIVNYINKNKDKEWGLNSNIIIM